MSHMRLGSSKDVCPARVIRGVGGADQEAECEEQREGQSGRLLHEALSYHQGGLDEVPILAYLLGETCT